MMTGEAAQRDGGGDGVAAVGVTRGYVCPARDQLFLLPVSMREWLDEGHLAWFVLDVVAEMNTGGLHRRPGGATGRRPYQPEMMCAVLLYAYCGGIRSSRRIEAACQTDAAFRVICGGLVPDHATIARFVVDHERALEGLFVEGVRLCAAAGLVDLSVVALDGTKIAADASIARNRDAAWIRGEVAKLMAVTAQDAQSAVVAADALPGLEPVAEISCAAGRLARLRVALAVIEAENRARSEQAARHAAPAVAAAERGRKLGGRKPQEPFAALARAEADHAAAVRRLTDLDAERDRRAGRASLGETPAGPRPRIDRAQRAVDQAATRLAAAVQNTPSAATAKANVTDPDSRIMSTKDGWVQGYNAQAIVNPHQIVLACQVSQNANDTQLYQPMNDQLTRTLHAANVSGEIELMLADAGYCSESNLTTPGPDRLIATTKDWKQRRTARTLGQTNGPPPDGTPTQEMEHLLRTPQGSAAYKQRSSLIEPVFGNHKHNRGIRTFRRRGLPAARSEWAFIQLAGNLLKLHHHRAATTAA